MGSQLIVRVWQSEHFPFVIIICHFLNDVRAGLEGQNQCQMKNEE